MRYWFVNKKDKVENKCGKCCCRCSEQCNEASLYQSVCDNHNDIREHE